MTGHGAPGPAAPFSNASARPIVKICGIRSARAAAWVAAAGADLAGLNFVPSSRRVIDLETARSLLPALGAVVPVGVFMDQAAEVVEDIAGRLGLTWIQLHGRESPEVTAYLAARFRVIRATSVTPGWSAAAIEPHRAHAAAFLVDGPRPGHGVSLAWETAEGRRPLAEEIAGLNRPWLLAGGLTPENVANAIRRLGPNGVDTASGIEIAGAEDEARIARFVREARGAR